MFQQFAAAITEHSKLPIFQQTFGPGKAGTNATPDNGRVAEAPRSRVTLICLQSMRRALDSAVDTQHL